MSVNIFGEARNGSSASHASVSVEGTAGNLNQRLIMLSNKLSQKVNKSGDTMDGDLKLKFKPDSSCVSLSFGVDGIDRDWSMALLLGNIHNQIYLSVNELIRKIYSNTASPSNLQTDMISRIEAQSSAVALSIPTRMERFGKCLIKLN